ncbi:VPS4-associated protein 1 [Multifurca ochricompacta]|uniref:VPS4-associated protein 1 n=1 Tax=Multifurca ochricompacta TaxID=376703 RepID=A0AAD4QP51_9AGAM|nr:VPS4-associated protein 1 [Multifurca ochricompacta]
MSFQNVYYKRVTATPRACYVCSKPTTTCLASTNTVDFVYTCDAHLFDTGFATEIVDPKEVSNEGIARVKADPAKETSESSRNGTGTEGGKEGSKENGPNSPSSPAPVALPSPPAVGSGAVTPTHKRYSLHRDFYAMRQAEYRRRRQAKQMQELAPRLPGAPHGSLAG